MHLSHTPPWCEAAGGLNIHLISCCKRNSWIWFWFHSWTAFRSSFSPLTKFPLLSDLISSGLPLLAMKRRVALINNSVSIEWTISMWTALMVRHVNKALYLLAMVHLRCTVNGPNKSTPTYVKGGLEGVTWSCGKLTIFCFIMRAWRHWQLKYVLRMLRTLDRAPRIQYLCLISDRVYLIPEWAEVRW